MFKNYLISALRFLKRNKIFTGINILGLSLALAASFIILLFVVNELSYNTYFKNRKQVYRVLNFNDDVNVTDEGDLKNIRIFSTMAILVIIIASLNYIILSTAVSTSKSKEIGIRKTNGASTQSIRKQLMAESLILSVLVLPIASFGLFGLTLFITKSQTKEIGIKKVCGSSGKGIIMSFLGKNFIMVTIAMVLSVPPTILAMNRWLCNFSFRTDIKWWVFALTYMSPV